VKLKAVIKTLLPVDPSDQVPLSPEDGNRTEVNREWLAMYPWSDMGVDFFTYSYFVYHSIHESRRIHPQKLICSSPGVHFNE
jgi:hypothetical protein